MSTMYKLKLPIVRTVSDAPEAERAIADVTAAVPLLRVRGMTIISELDRFSDGFSVENVATAIGFLRQCQKLKTPKLGSYGLKHVAEQWGARHGMQPYIANGELIVAAIWLDFNVEWDGSEPNVRIAVSTKNVTPQCA
jgi:hypothetical protein